MIIYLLVSLTFTFYSFFTYANHIPEINSEPPQCQSINESCIWNVSSKVKGACLTVADALNQECAQSDQYEINLLDDDHVEYLEISKNLTINIMGANVISCSWLINEQQQEMIILHQGNLTISNIIFRFSILNDSTISPTNFVIYAGSLEYDTSLTVYKCTFQSIQGTIINNTVQIFAANSNKVNITQSSFNGVSINYPQNITMIVIGSCPDIFIGQCTFQDALISSYGLAPVDIVADIPDALIVIKDCKFLNLNSSNTGSHFTFQIYTEQKTKVEIINNIFADCHGIKGSGGSLQLSDKTLNDGRGSEFIVKSNTFKHNIRDLTGGICMFSHNPNSNFNFNYNNFSQNHHLNEYQIGQDSALMIYNSSKDWNTTNIKEYIKKMFNMSRSDAKKDSVTFSVTFQDKSDILDSITLLKLNNKWQDNILVIIAFVLGSLVILAVGIALIVVVVIIHKKKQYKYQATIEERRQLIYRDTLRSI